MHLWEELGICFKSYGLGQKYLLAMSGGLDSTVLFDIMLRLGLDFSVAHVNYGLRGTASVADEEFVRKLCHKNQVPCFTKSVNIEQYQQENNASVQLAARKLRYEFFEELKQNISYNILITAHHMDDNIETFFINLLRGSGLQGLKGIKDWPNIKRPMKHIRKQEILRYAQLCKITWREDATNMTDAYLRNRIRHHLLPVWRNLDENFDNQIAKTMKLLSESDEIINLYISNLKKEIFISSNDQISIKLQNLKNIENRSVLYHLFSEYGFEHPLEIEKLLESVESAEIQSATHRFIKNREEIILINKMVEKISIQQLKDIETNPIQNNLKFTVLFSRPDDNSVYFDFNKIKFPLSLRLRQDGDIFYPLGMDGKSKKISKYFKDLKLSKPEKEKTVLLCDAADRILWVVGKRFDGRLIANEETTKWLQIEKLY
ncbi:MAG: tRNA lysidine(34) synthetase TilS [Flavobacteriaceae bacterium]|nr:tRNA lysidine(34) synthetase TilS [Flavobacteriaceae bacterium]